jgi:predicted adenylyl cyclase CyaB
MKEIEVKVLNVNKQKIEEILAQLGAKQTFDDEITTYFFDFENGSIANAKNLLRLRKEGKHSVLTFKKILSKQSAKVAEEYEVEVSNLPKMQRILELLGLSVTESIQKHRSSYELNDLRFDIDTLTREYAYIPTYLEIEAKNIKLIKKYAKILGYRAEECLPWTTNDLINFYAKKPS